MNVLEFNTDACILSNGAYVASFSLLIEVGTAPDNVRTRHYYGTLIPGIVPGGYQAVQHDAVTVLLETPDLLALAQTIAKDQAVAEFPIE